MSENLTAFSHTTSATIERTVVATGLTYDALVEAFERELGKWELDTEKRLISEAAPWSEVQREVTRMGGTRGILVFYRLDQGSILSLSGEERRSSLYLIGNPVVANGVLKTDPRAGLYVPFRVYLYDDGGPGGASLLYDRPSSFLGALGHPDLAGIGTFLDGKIDSIAQALVTLGHSNGDDTV